MKFSPLPIALLATVPSVFAQNLTFLTGLLQTLQNAGLTQLASVGTQLNSTTTGQYLLAAISTGDPYVLFAPTDDAFSNAPSNVTSDLSNLFAYHLVSGNFSDVATNYPNVTLGRTLLNDTNVVQLEGNKSQVLAWAVRSDGKTHILNQANESVVTNMISYGNLTINVISNVLSYPQSFVNTVPTDNSSLTALQSTLNGVNVPYYNASTSQTSDTSILTIINSSLHGFTLFAPNSSALESMMDSLQSLESNTTLLQIILNNHLINGTSVYSSELVGQNYTSAAGENLAFSINATGQYITSGNTTAHIIQPDVLLSNGVVHVIDRVLLNTNSDASAASSAVASATSAAAHSTTETQPIGFSQTATLVSHSGASHGAKASGSKSSAPSIFGGPDMLQIITMGMTIVGVLVGGLLTVA
ncbi:hypothetical protein AcV7_007057 [Taiwanofungus camphoratus]|nr:hypothetical protein AcV7_007057 [Antrodia cinnamomea]